MISEWEQVGIRLRSGLEQIVREWVSEWGSARGTILSPAKPLWRTSRRVADLRATSAHASVPTSSARSGRSTTFAIRQGCRSRSWHRQGCLQTSAQPSALEPAVFQISGASQLWATPPPLKFWASTPPTEFLKSVKNTPPMFLKKSRRSIRCTFRSTPLPCKLWASTSPTEFFKSVQNTPPFFEKNRGSILWTFRATPPPFKSWAPTPPVTPASDLSIWSWAFGPASFLMRNYACFWTWMLGDGTCHSSIGLVNLKLGRILNDKLCLFLDLHVGKRDLSLQHRTCLQMAIQTTIFVPIQTLDRYQLAPIQRS